MYTLKRDLTCKGVFHLHRVEREGLGDGGAIRVNQLQLVDCQPVLAAADSVEHIHLGQRVSRFLRVARERYVQPRAWVAAICTASNFPVGPRPRVTVDAVGRCKLCEICTIRLCAEHGIKFMYAYCI